MKVLLASEPEPFELLQREFRLGENIAQKGTWDVSARMVWYRRGSPIRMPIEHMTPVLPDRFKPGGTEDEVERSKVDQGQSAQISTSTC